MLIYNTTYHVEPSVEKLFLNWLGQYLLPEMQKDGRLKNPKVMRILSHHATDDGQMAAYAVQAEVENSAVLHQWYHDKGGLVARELNGVFGQKVLGLSTLMEPITEMGGYAGGR